MYLARFTAAAETLKVYLLFMINCGLPPSSPLRLADSEKSAQQIVAGSEMGQRAEDNVGHRAEGIGMGMGYVARTWTWLSAAWRLYDLSYTHTYLAVGQQQQQQACGYFRDLSLDHQAEGEGVGYRICEQVKLR